MRSNRGKRSLPREPQLFEIEKLSHEGRGLTRHEGQIVFVDGALPGETVRAEFTSRRGSYAEARTVEVGRNRVILGEVLWVHIGDEFVDAERLHVHADKLGLIARMHGAGWYARTSDLFEMRRMTVAVWVKQSGAEGAG